MKMDDLDKRDLLAIGESQWFPLLISLVLVATIILAQLIHLHPAQPYACRRQRLMRQVVKPLGRFRIFSSYLILNLNFINY